MQQVPQERISAKDTPLPSTTSAPAAEHYYCRCNCGQQSIVIASSPFATKYEARQESAGHVSAQGFCAMAKE
jgi:hypothetical protein